MNRIKLYIYALIILGLILTASFALAAFRMILPRFIVHTTFVGLGLLALGIDLYKDQVAKDKISRRVRLPLYVANWLYVYALMVILVDLLNYFYLGAFVPNALWGAISLMIIGATVGMFSITYSRIHQKQE